MLKLALNNLFSRTAITSLVVITFLIITYYPTKQSRPFNIQDQIRTFKLEIPLADELRHDPTVAESFVKLLKEIKTKLIVTNEEEYLSYEENIKIYHWITESLAKFALAHPDTNSALTAKLLCAFVLTQGISKENRNKAADNASILCEEIFKQHPHTWQAGQVYRIHLVVLYPPIHYEIIEQEKEATDDSIELLKYYQKQDLVDPPTNDPEFNVLKTMKMFDVITANTPQQAEILNIIFYRQLGIAYRHVDPEIATEIDQEWVEKAKKTKKELLNRYPNSEAAKQVREEYDI
jgi:hypothetical protein